MAEEPNSERLKRLSERLAEKRQDDKDEQVGESHVSSAEVGWRMVTELVVGLLLGAAIGYGLDVLFGTLPWLLIVFCMLGFAAGIKTMLRTAAEIQEKTNAGTGDGT
ncbi:MAG: AtpZ/AtpI family protein [Pseudomonadota bacterium]